VFHAVNGLTLTEVILSSLLLGVWSVSCYLSNGRLLMFHLFISIHNNTTLNIANRTEVETIIQRKQCRTTQQTLEKPEVTIKNG
jgi:hypothetical protein